MATLTLEDPPALADAHDCGASATVVIGPEPPPNRPIAVATAVAAAAHALALLTLGLASFHSGTKSPAVPEINLLVQLSGGQESQQQPAAPADEPAAPAAKLSENVVASIAGRRAADAGSPRRKAIVSDAPPKTEDSRSAATSATEGVAEQTAPSAGTVASDAPSTDGAVVTTIAASDREAPAQAATAPQEQPGVTIGSAQGSVLSRWIMEAAQGLQKANLKQVRLSLSHQGRKYIAFLERRPAADAMGVDHIRVEITTEQNGRLLRTLLQLKQLAFSHFTQLVDQWDPRQALHADSVEGRFHSNSEITLLSDGVAPRVLGKLTTSAGRVNSENFGYRALREIFRGGIETLVPPIALPADFSALTRARIDDTKVRSFARNTRVTFYPDGSYGWRDLQSNSPEERAQVSAPHYILAARGATIAVQGTVRGTVVVYSPEGIVVEGNLRYAHDPRGPDADDYLGLVSNKDVAVAPQSVTGPGDLEIQAAIYARRRFFVPDGYVPPGPSGCPCPATLFIHGSLTAGWLSPTEPRYATHYDFDQRFEQVRPPGFPVTNHYEVESWDTQWRETKTAAGGSAQDPAAAPVSTAEAPAPSAGSAALDLAGGTHEIEPR